VLRAFAMLVSILAFVLRRRARVSLRECHTEADTNPEPQAPRDQQETRTTAASGETTHHRQPQGDLSSRTCAARAGTHSSAPGLGGQWLPALQRFALPAGMTTV